MTSGPVPAAGRLDLRAGTARPAVERAFSVQTDVSLLQLQMWLRAVMAHTPGADDEHARLFAPWSSAELQNLLTDLQALRDSLAQALSAKNAAGDHPPIAYAGRQLSAADVQGLLGLTDDEAARGDANRILKRALLFHTDIVVLVPAQVRQNALSASQSVVKARAGYFGVQ